MASDPDRIARALDEARQATDARDEAARAWREAICNAVDAGASIRQVAAAIGISPTHVHRICRTPK